MGNASAMPTHLNDDARISNPPGARLSSATVPSMITDDSIPDFEADSNSSSGTTPFLTVTWMMPVESLRTAKTIPPLHLVRYIQPLTWTFLPTWSLDRAALIGSIQKLKGRARYKPFGYAER